jgi:hypothetical protein
MMHSLRRSVPVAAVLAVALLVVAPSTDAAGVWRMDERLPEPVAMTCAVHTGAVVYVFGGSTKGAILDSIYSVDPENGRSTIVPFTLPSPRKMASAVWTGNEAYIIGGIGYDAEPIAEIVRFVPGVGVEVVEGAMPYGTKGVPSVWDGEAVHVLGNCLSAEVGQHDVVRYHPGNGTTEVLEDVLPIPGAGSSAVWAGDRAYIVGGRSNQTILSDRVVSYVPGKGAEFVEARLPRGRIGAASAWDGEVVYAFGGTIALECGPLECVPTDYLDEIVVFDPVNDTCQLSDHTLPRPMDLRAAVHTVTNHGSDHRVLIPGGLTATGPVDWLTVYDPRSSFPPEVPGEERTVVRTLMRWISDNEFLFFGILIGSAVIVAFFIWLVRQREEEDELLEQYKEYLEEQRGREG